MFKCLLIGQWHGLSDPKLEESLRVRFDFMLFAGLDLDCTVPDETTHCRFRNALVKAGAYDALLAEVCRQIEGHGLKIKEAGAAIIDATLIESAARPRTHVEAPPEDRAENEAPDEPAIVIFSADNDARWVKKGRKSTLVDSPRQKSLFVGFPFDLLYATVLDAYRNIIHGFIGRPRTA